MGYGSSADGTWPWDDLRQVNNGLICETKTNRWLGLQIWDWLACL